MINPTCDFCGHELFKFGGLLFSPPDENSMVKKYHICAKCFPSFEEKKYVRRRKPVDQPKDWHGRNAPFSAKDLEEEMDKLCGCKGCRDCDCPLIKNQALQNLWSWHNFNERQEFENRRKI
jgi:hypothetical protein